MNKALQINKLGQSIWYDNIARTILIDGSLEKMIENKEIFGVTSNPSIFKNAITSSDLYDQEINKLSQKGFSAFEIYDELSIADIQEACDVFLDYYHESNYKDGYVSLEVDPRLAYKTNETISEAKRLWKKVNRPNLMIKIPATKQGIDAIAAVTSEGINVNVTLIFSNNRYKEVMNAYLTGLEKALEKGILIDKIHSVASFFISRLDSKMDSWINDKEKDQNKDFSHLKGKIAVGNGKIAYQNYLEIIESKRWKNLESQLASMQRPLWASTSTKNPNYPDTLYVDELIAENTVNTIPPKTLALYLDHGKTKISIFDDLDLYKEKIKNIDELGLSLEKATDELEKEGVQSFSEAFQILLDSIKEKM